MIAMFHGYAQGVSEHIRLNQIGFYTNSVKTAIVIGDAYSEFYVTLMPSGKKVFQGMLGEARESKFSKTKTKRADFTGFTSPGTYVLVVPGLGQSPPFEIGPSVNHPLLKASIKAFYFHQGRVRKNLVLHPRIFC